MQEQLGDNVTKEQVAGLAEIFKSYDLRMTIAGDKELDGVIWLAIDRMLVTFL